MVGRPQANALLAVAALLLGGCLAPALAEEPTVHEWPEPPQRVPSREPDWPDDPNWTAQARRPVLLPSQSTPPSSDAPDDADGAPTATSTSSASPAASTSSTGSASSASRTWSPWSRTSSPSSNPHTTSTRAGGTTQAPKVWANWESERAAHGPVGLAAAIDLGGDGARLDGPMELSAQSLQLVPAPLFPAEAPLMFLKDATVDGVGSGLLILEGPADISSTTPVRLAVDGVTLGARSEALAALSGPGLPEPLVPDGWDAARRGAFFAHGEAIALDHATVQGFTRGLLVQGNSSTAVSGPLVVSAPSIHWEEGSAVRAGDAGLSAPGAFSFAAEGANGFVRPAGRDAVTDVLGFVATGGHLDLDGGRVRDGGDVRVTQVIDPDGFVLGAAVQVVPDKTSVTVARNGTAWVLLHFRESTYIGDAVLESVEVTGNGSQAVELPLRPPPSAVDELFTVLDAFSDVPPLIAALPMTYLALGVFITAPFVAIAETLSCMFGGCPWKSTYPSYMGAGQVGTGYLKVHPDLPPGTYDVTVHIHGANHAQASFPLQFTVT